MKFMFCGALTSTFDCSVVCEQFLSPPLYSCLLSVLVTLTPLAVSLWGTSFQIIGYGIAHCISLRFLLCYSVCMYCVNVACVFISPIDY